MFASGLKVDPIHGRILMRTTGVRVPPQPPEGVVAWQSNENLGTFANGEEFSIPLLFSDTSNVVSNITITSGSLPFGVQLNPLEKEIAGIANLETSMRFDITLALHTPTGLVSKSFYFDIETLASQVVWNTDQDLGAYSGGSGVNIGIEAQTVKVKV